MRLLNRHVRARVFVAALEMPVVARLRREDWRHSEKVVVPLRLEKQLRETWVARVAGPSLRRTRRRTRSTSRLIVPRFSLMTADGRRGGHSTVSAGFRSIVTDFFRRHHVMSDIELLHVWQRQSKQRAALQQGYTGHL